MEKVVLTIDEIMKFRQMANRGEQVTLEGVTPTGKLFSVTSVIALVGRDHLFLNFGCMLGKYELNRGVGALTVLQMKDAFHEMIYINPQANEIRRESDNAWTTEHEKQEGVCHKSNTYPNQEQNLNRLRSNLGKPVLFVNKQEEKIVLAVDYENNWQAESTTFTYQTTTGMGSLPLSGKDEISALAYQDFLLQNSRILN